MTRPVRLATTAPRKAARRWRHGAWMAAVLVLSACSPGAGTDPQALRDAAENALSRGDRPAALVSLKAALQARPDHADTRFVLGRTLLEMGEPAGATTELRRAIELGFPKDVAAPLLVRALALSGRAREAVSQHGDERPADPHAASELALALAVAWDLLGDPARLRATLDRALAVQPGHPDARLLVTRLQAAEGQPEAAWQGLTQLLADEPRHAGAWQTQGLLLRTWKLDPEAALAAQAKALEIDPSLVSAHDEILTVHAARGDLDALRRQLRALDQVQPGHPVGLYFKAQADAMEGRWSAARETLLALLKRGPDVPRFVRAAAVADQQLGDSAQARARLVNLLARQPADGESRLLLARLQLATGEAPEALRTLQPLLDAPRPSLEALLAAVDAEAARGRAAEALKWFQQAALAAPQDRRVQLLQGLQQARSATPAVQQEGLRKLAAMAAADAGIEADRALVQVHLTRNQTAAALAAIDGIERKRPGRGDAPLLRSEVQRRAGDLAGARQSLEMAAAREPSDWAAAAGLVQLDLAVPDVPAALSRLDAFLTRNPGSSEATLLRARLSLQLDEPPAEVARRLAAYVGRQPQDIVVRLALIDTLLSSGADEAALQAAREGLAAAPDNPSMLYMAGRAQLQRGQASEALRLFAQIDSLAPGSPWGNLGRAESALRASDLTAASAEVQRAVEAAPTQPDVRRWQHRVAMESGRLEQALGAARALQAAAPRDPLGHALEGETHLKAQRWNDAASAFERALQRGRSSRHALQRHLALLNAGRGADADRFAADWLKRWPDDVALRMHLGDVAGARKRWADAEVQYRHVARLRPEAAVVHNNLAWALLQQGKPEAVASAERAVQLGPRTPAFMDTLAGALAAAGQLPRALALQKELVGLPGASPTMRLHLAQLAARSGDAALARSTAQALDPAALTPDEQAERQRLLRGG